MTSAAPTPVPTEGAARAPRTARAPMVTWPEYMKQWQAAAYLSVSERFFRGSVDVPPVQLSMPKPGKKPVFRWRRSDLDAWVDRCSTFKLRKG